jgi:ABC-2 type transport system ATP-binding protein
MIPIWASHVTKSFARRSEALSRGAQKQSRMVLSDVTLQVGEGEIVCLVGKNGSGKTTLTRIISTLVEPDEGEVRVCGFDVGRDGSEVRRRIGVMLNAGDGGFQARFSGLGNLEYYAALYQIRSDRAKVRIRQLMTDVGLEDRGADQYQSYSSGMRRRLALSRAMLPDPEVLLLDEPTLGVDPWSTNRIHATIRGLSARGKAILCTTNSVIEARSLANKILVLEEGMLSSHSALEFEVT